MNRRFFWAAISAAVLTTTLLSPAGVARADIPLPGHLTYIHPQMAFEGIAEQPDYVYYLRYLTFTGGPGGIPHSTIEVRDSKPFVLNCQRRLFDMKLLAIKRADFEKRSKAERSLDWLTDKAEGVLAVEVESPSTVAPKAAKQPPLTTYRVKWKDGKPAVEVVSRAKDQEANSGSVLPNSMAGLALAAGLASLGMLIMRRRNTARSAA
jgi:hypothetical protein